MARKEADGKIKTAKAYKLTYRRLRDFWGSETMDFGQLSVDTLENFHEFLLKNRGNNLNSTSIHERNLRAVFNKVIAKRMIKADAYPFREFKVLRKTEALHKNLSLTMLARVRDADLSSSVNRREAVEQARDLFMFSFNMVGMNLIDLWEFSPAHVNSSGVVEMWPCRI